MPGLVNDRLILVSGPNVAAWIESFRAWRQGLEFDLRVATAPGAVGRDEYGGSALKFDLLGHSDENQLFELGITTADQETSNAPARTWPSRRIEPTELMLEMQSGGGGHVETGGYWCIT